ncbi:efflux RND transporter periplasmic adaptor subunit [Marinoscillum sp. MHG1-6]|uniref:efflux RND transporter periplasmic adaptor subunit n=1 Tax=Marinoscillum sp. MHG1-6 TaxID=2959627 RepID=UPI002157B5ED|nr:efflux RND transporter periplasmic adaptor subunit [Marinoscillum sp. MHG1-6]
MDSSLLERLKGKRAIFLSVGGILLAITLFFILGGQGTSDGANIIVDVEKGKFVVEVNTTGELEARNSTLIMGPNNLRRYRIWNVTIQKIIPEGTYVQKGDFVAFLDPSEINGRIKDTEERIEELVAKVEETRLDTALQMKEARNKLINLKYAVEEKQLILDQSEFEAPATIKKAEIELDKSLRALKQEEENYQLKSLQNKSKMRSTKSDLFRVQRDLEDMKALQREFTIKAPEDGMIIYRKGYGGRAIKEGSQINAWDLVVATLPDLSTMNSITYVNEVDIRRIKVGQAVTIGLDAFPDKQLTGKVTDVANVGEQRPNSDAKVFKVTVAIDKIDDETRPGMTTSNNIITKEIEDAIYIPLECLHSQADSISYVYISTNIGYRKHEVLVGETNANSAQILMGLSEQDRIYLSTPTNEEGEILLLKELDGKRNEAPKKQVTDSVPSESPDKQRQKKYNK